MFANIQNYHNYHNKKLKFYNLTNCKCAFLYIDKFAHAKFACFHTCMYYKIIKLQTYKFAIFKVCKLEITKLWN